MRRRPSSRTAAAASLALVALLAGGSSAPAQNAPPLRFAVSLAPGLGSGPVSGRLLVIVSREARPEPRLQADAGGVTDTPPLFGKDVRLTTRGSAVVGARGVWGYPVRSLASLPAGDYAVQALLNVYTRFRRADGSVVSLHMPCGDGNDLFVSPGNLVSRTVRVRLDPAAGGTVHLRLARTLPPLQPVPAGGTCQQGNFPDSPHVKFVKIRSRLLSRFWGRPMYLGANVLLPQGYDAPANRHVRYPVIWQQTHFPGGDAPFGFSERGKDDFSRFWRSKTAPRVIAVEIRHENPFFDDSYAVDSANLGPWGSAITRELLPVIDKRFRAIPARWARTTTGGSTGGWEALAQQVFYPRLYDGAWVFYPDPVDFHFHQVVDIYRDANAYVHEHEWLKVPRPSARETSGDTIWTIGEENHWELALGTRGRSGLGQWDIWQAVFGPQGPDGYPAPIWNKVTGRIHHDVARAWRAKDVDQVLHANWPTLGPLLTRRIHFFVGTADTFFLNDAVQRLQHQIGDLSSPAPRFSFRYGINQPHGWSPYSDAQLVTIMARSMAQHAPAGTNVRAWLRSGAPVRGTTPAVPAAPARRLLDTR